MIRWLILCVILLAANNVSLGQDYDYSGDDVSLGDETFDYTYETKSSYRRNYSGDPASTIDPGYDSGPGVPTMTSKDYGDEYLIKPGAFDPERSQEQKMQKKVTDVTAGTFKTLLIFGVIGICVVAFLFNNMR